MLLSCIVREIIKANKTSSGWSSTSLSSVVNKLFQVIPDLFYIFLQVSVFFLCCPDREVIERISKLSILHQIVLYNFEVSALYRVQFV